MDSVIVRCWEPMQAHKALTRQAWPALKAALIAGQRMVVKVEQEKRSLAQNARLWAIRKMDEIKALDVTIRRLMQ